VIQLRPFIVTLALTTALGATGPAAVAGGPTRELAASQGTVAVGPCNVSARLIQVGDKVLAQFTAVNTGADAEAVDFHYSVFRTADVSMMLRMLPSPEQVAQGRCSLTVGANETLTHTVLLREGVTQPVAVEAKNALGLGSTGASWNLMVASDAIDAAAGWGAVPPSVGEGIQPLSQAHVVLASNQFGIPFSG
jgi:hypothetical protein